MSRRQLTLVAGLLVVAATLTPTVALGHTSKVAYDWHVGDVFLQSLGFPVGEQAIAPNGDVLTIQGTGSFSADGKWATGGGTFSHHVAATNTTITGTFTADRVISFQFYGCGTEGLPPNFCGGLLDLAITATPDAAPSVHLAGSLRINCEIGPNLPASVVEGVRVNVYDVINFNKPVAESGANVYIAK